MLGLGEAARPPAGRQAPPHLGRSGSSQARTRRGRCTDLGSTARTAPCSSCRPNLQESAWQRPTDQRPQVRQASIAAAAAAALTWAALGCRAVRLLGRHPSCGKQCRHIAHRLCSRGTRASAARRCTSPLGQTSLQAPQCPSWWAGRQAAGWAGRIGPSGGPYAPACCLRGGGQASGAGSMSAGCSKGSKQAKA